MQRRTTQSSTIEDSFRPRISPHWSRIQTGGGQLVVMEEGLRLMLAGAQPDRYADAQIDDYDRLPRHAFPWRPPLRLEVHARAGRDLRGTAGFGFWNNPFSPLVEWPALPAAIWFFFASAPSNLPLAQGVSGTGWKAACIDATRAEALAWAPLVLPVVLLNRIPAAYRRIWPLVQRSLAISEAAIPALDQDWHTCSLEWRTDGARFSMDGRTVLETDRAPRGPLGFVAWVDNQWAVATPQGQLGAGLLASGAQWLDLGLVRIEPIDPSSSG